MLDEAIAENLVEITEIDRGGSVPVLKLKNKSDTNVFLMDGEQLIGAKQNRILNLSVLAAGNCDLEIPVSCVEQGRWSWRSKHFGSSGNAAHGTVRARKARSVSESMRTRRSRRSDQGEIWADIRAKTARMHTHSETTSMDDMYASTASRVEAAVVARPTTPTTPSQVGAAFAVRGRLCGVDVFEHPAVAEKLLPKLIRSYTLDTLDPGTAGSEQAGVSLGRDLRLNDDTLSGGALVEGQRVVHLSAFAPAA